MRIDASIAYVQEHLRVGATGEIVIEPADCPGAKWALEGTLDIVVPDLGTLSASIAFSKQCDDPDTGVATYNLVGKARCRISLFGQMAVFYCFNW